MKTGHNAGTQQAESRTGSGSRGSAKDERSSALAFTPRLLDLKASAHYLSVGLWTVRQLVWDGRLPVVKIPRTDGSGDMNRVLIDRNDLDAFIAGLPKEYES
jgi:hypothetical protein